MDKFYLDLTRKWLINLLDYKKNLNILEILHEEIMDDNPIDYAKDRLSPTHKIYLNTEEKAIRLYEIERIIKSLKNKINIIEESLEKLRYLDQKILRLRYIERWKIKFIAEELNYSYVHTCRILNKALYKLRDNLFGILIE